MKKQNIQILIEFFLGIVAIAIIYKLGSFEKVLSTNVINFAIEIWLLSIIYRKAKLSSVIQKMADDIRISVEKSESDTNAAIKNYEEVKKSIKDTPKLRDEIFQNAKNLAAATKVQFENDIEVKKVDIQTNLTECYKNDEEKYKKLTTDEIYAASLNLAKDEILNKLDSNMHLKLINNALSEIDNVELNHWRKS